MAEYLYPICRLYEESTTHTLWKCEGAKDVWAQCHKKIQKLSLPPLSFLDIWSHLSNSLNQFKLQAAAYITKLILNKRNDWVHNDKFLHPNLLLAKAQEELTSYLSAQNHSNLITSSQTASPNNLHWLNPPLVSLRLIGMQPVIRR